MWKYSNQIYAFLEFIEFGVLFLFKEFTNSRTSKEVASEYLVCSWQFYLDFTNKKRGSLPRFVVLSRGLESENLDNFRSFFDFNIKSDKVLIRYPSW